MPYPANWIRSAIESQIGKSKFRKPYIAGILQGYAERGGPDPKEPATSFGPPSYEIPTSRLPSSRTDSYDPDVMARCEARARNLPSFPKLTQELAIVEP